jgi:2-iminobutanoate/2-iminopropanoate deaminase
MTPSLPQTVQVPGAPRAIGPYSQAKIVSLGEGAPRLVFTAGQIGLDPQTGELVAGGVGEQTDRALRNLAAVLAGASLTLAQVVKTTVYLADMAEFEAMNQVYARHFPELPPARTTIAAAGLPRGARVEIEVVAAGPAS